MRERVEDLGRLAVMLQELLDREFWDLYMGRKKDFVDYVNSLDQEKRDELFHAFIYGLHSMQESVGEMCIIAEGLDRLNEPS